jgi:putative ABC transport system permease protein
MIKNYFLVALRTFWRNKTFSAINILGLAIGISASLVIFLLVQYDFTFDKFEKDPNRIYRIVTDIRTPTGNYHGDALSEPMADAVKNEVPGIALVVPFHTLDNTRITIPNTNNTFRKQKDIVAVDPNYFQLINYTWLAGSPETSITQPYQLVLTESNAKRYYPNLRPKDIVNKPVILDDTVLTTITGIVKDLPGNSDFYFGAFLSRATLKTARMRPENFGQWDWANDQDQLFIKSSPNTNSAEIQPQLTKVLRAHSNPHPFDHGVTTVLLQPLSDLHFNPDYGVFTESRQAHKPTLYGLLAVATFLLLLAMINFINLTTAQASQRAKEIGIRKTMGSQRRQLIIQFLTETFVFTLAATILSIILTPFLLTIFAGFIPEDLHFSWKEQPGVFLFLGALILTVTFFAGIYPALILSGFKPILVLKNQSAAGQIRTAWLRKSLTVFQFVIAQLFIIGTLIVGKQISYALNKDLGFKKDAIVYFRTDTHPEGRKKKPVLFEKLKALPGVAMVSIANSPPGSNGNWNSTMTVNDGQKDIEVKVLIKLADTNYFRMYGLHLLAGKPLAHSDTISEAIINQAYLRQLGFQDPQKIIGKKITKFRGNPTIVGVVADFHSRSLHEPIKPLMIANGTNLADIMNVALQPRSAAGPNWPKTLAAIEKAFHEVYPNDDFEYKFVDDTVAKFYTAETNTAKLLAWATGLTIFISCLGLLGLVIYVTNQRTKEIGIRKVIGATVTQLIILLSRDFLKLIGLAIAIALPVAVWGSRKWLDNFAYKTQLNWWIFAGGGTTLLSIALIILIIRTLKTATANPVNALRSE